MARASASDVITSVMVPPYAVVFKKKVWWSKSSYGLYKMEKFILNPLKEVDETPMFDAHNISQIWYFLLLLHTPKYFIMLGLKYD